MNQLNFVKEEEVFCKTDRMNTAQRIKVTATRHMLGRTRNTWDILLRNQGPEHMPRMHRSLKAHCATLLIPLCFRRSQFNRQMSPRPTRRERSKKRKVELVGENINRIFWLNVDFHVTFRDLLHAVNLRHGTDGFTSPPKEGALRIFRP
jgi:hypothetical protein